MNQRVAEAMKQGFCRAKSLGAGQRPCNAYSFRPLPLKELGRMSYTLLTDAVFVSFEALNPVIAEDGWSNPKAGQCSDLIFQFPMPSK